MYLMGYLIKGATTPHSRERR